MRTHIFTGNTSREVLHKVKQALGDDALILSNRARDGAIEVVALAARDLAAPGGAPLALNDTPEVPHNVLPAFEQPVAPAPVTAPKVVQHFRPIETAPVEPAPVIEPAPAVIEAPAAPRAAAADIDGILSEIQNLKTLLRQDIAALSVETPAPAPAAAPTVSCSSAFKDLLNAGFSPQLSRRVAGAAQANESAAHALDRAAARIAQEIKVADADEIINAGGVYALVGPTGVGKTTTVAKLAARAVVRFGASKVALLTTDGYRIGAHDQLRIYARILSVPVHAIRDANDLAATLADLSGKHLVLIDTIGMSQRDRMVAEQTAMLAASDRVKRLLLVSATANAATLNQVVSIYKSSGVHGCILTKTDEAASLAPALDAVIRHELPLHYVTDGQRVPEDLQLPDAAGLVAEALNPTDEGFDLTAEELSLFAQAPEVAPAPVTPPTAAPAPAPAAAVCEPAPAPASLAEEIPPFITGRAIQAAQVVHG